MNSLYDVQIRKDNEEFYKRKSEHWMQTEYDDNVVDKWRFPNGFSIKMFKNDNGLDGNNDLKKHCLVTWQILFPVTANKKSVISLVISTVLSKIVKITEIRMVYIEKKILGCVTQTRLGE